MLTKWPLRIKEVADGVGVAHSTLRREIHAGKLVGKKIGRQWRFARPHLVAYLGEDVVKNLFDDQDGPTQPKAKGRTE